jgi:hypothetical protein
MFPRRLFPARYFAPRFFPQSQGEAPAVVTPTRTGELAWDAADATGVLTWDVPAPVLTWE